MFNRNVPSASTGHGCEGSTLAEAVNSFDTTLPKSKLHDMTPQKSAIICLCDKGLCIKYRNLKQICRNKMPTRCNR